MHRYHHRFQHRYTLPAIIVLLIITIGVMLFGVINLRRNTTVPRGANMSVLGVELDQNVDNVDLHQLQKAGISFVYLRATTGASYFDDNYLIYRDRVQGTKLSYGSIVTFSNQSSVNAQLAYFQRKVGTKTGNLPIMIVPSTTSTSKKYWQKMARFSQALVNSGKQVLIVGSYKKKKYFAPGTQFLYTGASLKDKKEYAFWCYTQAGRVKNVQYLDSNVTMFAYIGSMATYQARYQAEITQ